MTLGASIFEDCYFDMDDDERRGSSRRDYSSTDGDAYDNMRCVCLE
eukprot:CAMPEP_0113430754 /NCGR_PEP_ID=MMETSP0013_2-20120614/33190_1 /TAXON_ID=2843 ORGANISM="Skeletonema costatum, Strain 1716" /NCGR_SAMPLE_ID=MMETSP0013_2 /ASSEMBLY_ACC=CAM_ASM_000158 /LENGTH=45 /DNA_ID=CAMNT_0000319641 /DNA_START=16 /DNA_END=153 /DNA_ORIENTATION=- /assembly_acc=CAM_ASM_000158